MLLLVVFSPPRVVELSLLTSFCLLWCILQYAELKPVPCITYSDAESLRETCATPILKQVNFHSVLLLLSCPETGYLCQNSWTKLLISLVLLGWLVILSSCKYHCRGLHIILLTECYMHVHSLSYLCICLWGLGRIICMRGLGRTICMHRLIQKYTHI